MISGNTFDTVATAGIDLTASAVTAGLVANDTIDNNTFKGNAASIGVKIYNPTGGITAAGNISALVITNNDFSMAGNYNDGFTGVSLIADGTAANAGVNGANEIEHNTFAQNMTEGIVLDEAATAVFAGTMSLIKNSFHYSVADGAGEYAINTGNLAIVVDAEKCWFGRSTGPSLDENDPGTGAKLEDGAIGTNDVDFIPWKLESDLDEAVNEKGGLPAQITFLTDLYSVTAGEDVAASQPTLTATVTDVDGNPIDQDSPYGAASTTFAFSVPTGDGT
jgi:hypothetical protein